jgi:hypothetical protein
VNWKAAGIENWPRQGTRHRSNWLTKHKDINKLVLQSGHDSVDTMWRHYHRGATEADAKKFWVIVPKARKANTAAFAARRVTPAQTPVDHDSTSHALS